MTNVVTPSPFFYDEQIKKYILQFMAVFSNLKVEFAKRDDRDEVLVPVYLTYGAKDRIVASIIGDNVQNKPLRLPALAANLANIDLALDRMKGQGVNRRFNTLPRGGLLPDDIKTIDQRMPIPYNMLMDLSVYTSNLDEHFQILEQILVMFNPQIDIQRSEDEFDWGRIVSVELVAINNELNYPSGADRRIIQSTMQFQIKMHLTVPTKIREDFIKTIRLRVGLVEDIVNGSQDMLQQLDENGFDYSTIFDFDRDVNLS